MTFQTKRDLALLRGYLFEDEGLTYLADDFGMDRKYVSNRIRNLAKKIAIGSHDVGQKETAAYYDLTPKELSAIIYYHHAEARPRKEVK